MRLTARRIVAIAALVCATFTATHAVNISTVAGVGIELHPAQQSTVQAGVGIELRPIQQLDGVGIEL